MADGKRLLSAAGVWLLNATGLGDICEDCCQTLGTCNCSKPGALLTGARMQMTISWTESEWQASQGYARKTIVKYTPDPMAPLTYYLFIKQNAGTHTSGGSAPSWDTTVGNTTTDGPVTWVRIPNNFSRKYWGCLWANGDSKELCPGVHTITHNTTGSVKTDYERWWMSVSSKVELRRNWVQALSQYWSHGNVVSRRFHPRSSATGYTLPTRNVSPLYVHTKWNQQYHGTKAPTYYGTTPIPPATRTIGSPQVKLSHHVSPVTASDLTAVKLEAANAPLNATTKTGGLEDAMFGSNTDSAGITFTMERMSPAQAVHSGTPVYWARTAP